MFESSSVAVISKSAAFIKVATSDKSLPVISTEISADIVSHCNEEGILINAVRPNVIRFFPPLNVSEGEMNQAVKILEEALEEEKI